jgi:hypothetical protein
MKKYPAPIIKLLDLLDGENTAFGNAEGRAVFHKLADAADGLSDHNIIGISLAGMKRTDASFPRESIIAFAKSKRGEKGFYLIDTPNRDLYDNWDYAAKAKDQNLIVIEDDDYSVIGPSLNEGTTELLDYVFSHGRVTTAALSVDWDISPPNASAKLKKLYNQGLVLGRKESASSGGHEYVYKAIKPE